MSSREPGETPGPTRTVGELGLSCGQEMQSPGQATTRSVDRSAPLTQQMTPAWGVLKVLADGYHVGRK